MSERVQEMSAEAAALWERTRIGRWPGELVLASLPHASLGCAAHLVARAIEGREDESFAAIVVEPDEVSLTIDAATWAETADEVEHAAVAGPYVAISLLLDIDLGVCGYLLPAARRLADAGISIVPQCAFRKDHLVIRAEDAERAVAILESVVSDARREVGDQSRER